MPTFHSTSGVQLIRPVSRQLVIVPLHSKKMTRPCAVHRPSGEHRLLLFTNNDECYG
jgi:hypothetical protein